MSFFRKRYRWAFVYSFLLTAFTLYVALDTFVIPRSYRTVSPGGSSTMPGAAGGDSAPSPSEGMGVDPAPADPALPFTDTVVSTDHTYSDANISITITEYREYDTAIYVADVVLRSADFFKTAFAKSAFGRNVTQPTSEIAAQNGAVLAINGDFYGAQTKGYVLKNGVLYRETAARDREDLIIWGDGSFAVIAENEVSAADLLERGAAQILSFGPALVEDGTVSVSEADEVGKAMASNPRTAIGAVDALHYLLVVADGRTDASEELTLYQLAEFMQRLGAKMAYNLDGGGSSTMVFGGAVINRPTTNGRVISERSVSDIVYIAA